MQFGLFVYHLCEFPFLRLPVYPFTRFLGSLHLFEPVLRIRLSTMDYPVLAFCLSLRLCVGLGLDGSESPSRFRLFRNSTIEWSALQSIPHLLLSDFNIKVMEQIGMCDAHAL